MRLVEKAFIPKTSSIRPAISIEHGHAMDADTHRHEVTASTALA